MKSSILSLILILSFSSSIGYSQPPAPPIPVPSTLLISGPSTFAEGTLASYSVSGSTNVAFQVFPIGSGSSYVTSDGVFIFTAPSGQYQLLAATTDKNNKIVFLNLAITVTPSGGVSGPLAIAIFDSSTLTSLPSGQIGIYQSQTISASLAAKGITWLQYDTHDIIPAKGGGSPIMSTSWGTSAALSGLPALVLSINGQVSSVPLPGDEAGVILATNKLKLNK